MEQFSRGRAFWTATGFVALSLLALSASGIASTWTSRALIASVMVAAAILGALAQAVIRRVTSPEDQAAAHRKVTERWPLWGALAALGPLLALALKAGPAWAILIPVWVLMFGAGLCFSYRAVGQAGK